MTYLKFDEDTPKGSGEVSDSNLKYDLNFDTEDLALSRPSIVENFSKFYHESYGKTKIHISLRKRKRHSGGIVIDGNFKEHVYTCSIHGKFSTRNFVISKHSLDPVEALNLAEEAMHLEVKSFMDRKFYRKSIAV